MSKSGEIFLEFLPEALRGLGGDEGIDHLDCGGPQDGVAFETRLASDGGGDVALAEADAAEQDDVGFGIQKGQAHEIHDVGAIDLLGPGPIEGVEGFRDGEAGGLQPPLDAVLPPAVAFAFEEAFEVVGVGPAFLGGLFGEFFVMLEAPDELKFLEVFGKASA